MMESNAPKPFGLAISVEFLHRTFRADPFGTANTGRLERGEWPPSPSRLFAALVASDGTGSACRATGGLNQQELRWLEEQPPPIVGADSPTQCLHNPILPRFVVGPKSVGKSCHEYVARTAVLARAGVRVAPRSSNVIYLWKNSPDADLLNALRLRCARVGYLGGADSPVRLRVETEKSISAFDDHYVPSVSGEISMNVPASGHLAILDRIYSDWLKRGPSIARSQYPALQNTVRYQSPTDTAFHPTGTVVAWLRARRRSGSGLEAISGRRISAVTALFKAAVLQKYQKLHGEPPPELHGHGYHQKGYDLARYLALPDVGYKWSRGRIHGLALWVPASSTFIGQARDAARSVQRLVGFGIDVHLENHGGEKRPLAASPERWVRKSKRWATAFPAIHERRCRLDINEISRWCHHAGLPAPIAFRTSRSPLVPGAVDLAPVEVNHPGRKGGKPYSHVELLFGEPLMGPIAIGSGRQRGLGLCVPVDGTDF